MMKKLCCFIFFYGKHNFFLGSCDEQSSKNDIYLGKNIINAFIVTFDKFKPSFQNKSIDVLIIQLLTFNFLIKTQTFEW